MIKTKKIGDLGEKLALDYLLENGFKCVSNNYHSRYGEIDIICENEKYIVFVEVKSRKKGTNYPGVEAVDRSKRAKILKTSFDYLLKNPTEKQPRFDVIEVEFPSQKITHYENAFSGDEYGEFF